MSKIDLDPITSGYNLSKINANFQKVEDELNNKVLYRNPPAGEPNSMSSNLDMNSRAILNASKISSNVLELGGVQVVPTSLATDPYNGTREALRRSYAEAGYNLVDGSFEAGGTLVNDNDVLLKELTGKAFSGPAGTVAAGTTPSSGGFVDRSGEAYIHFSSVADMKMANWLRAGAYVKTASYHSGSGSVARKGGASYRIISDTNNQNDSTKIAITGTSLSAELLWDGVNFDISWAGAKLDQSTDDSDAIQSALIVLGHMNNTFADNLFRDINVVFNGSFKVTKRMWCGFNNLNIIMNGDCLVSVAQLSSGGHKSVFDFDYALVDKPVSIPLIDGAVANGGAAGFNKNHKLSFINTDSGLSWGWTKEFTEVSYTLKSNPANGNRIFIDGRGVIFGTDVTIGASAEATATNLANYLAANHRGDWAKVSGASTVVSYRANPFFCLSETPAVTVSKFTPGLAAARQSNAWNCTFKFVRCDNFPIQMFEEPISKNNGDGTYSEYGTEQCTYDFGKSTNVQIVHLIGGRLVTSTNIAERNTVHPYSIDHHVERVSVKLSNFASIPSLPHTVFAYFGKVFRISSSRNVEVEAGFVGVPRARSVCVLLVASDSWAADIGMFAKHELYTHAARIFPACWKDESEPNGISLTSLFSDFNAVPKFSDFTARKACYTSLVYAGGGKVTESVNSPFIVEHLRIGDLFEFRNKASSDADVPGLNWYNNANTAEVAKQTATYVSTGDKTIRCDGFNGPGVTVTNSTGGNTRLWVSHRGASTTRLIVRMVDILTGVNILTTNVLGHHGQSQYNPTYNAFVSDKSGDTAFQISVPAGYRAQIFVLNTDNPSVGSAVYSLTVRQHYNEAVAWKRPV